MSSLQAGGVQLIKPSKFEGRFRISGKIKYLEAFERRKTKDARGITVAEVKF